MESEHGRGKQRVWQQYIQVLRQLKKDEEALRTLEKALKMFPDFLKLWLAKADIL